MNRILLTFPYDLPSSIGQIANLLDCTSWSGIGPALMDAATKGALQAGKPVGGFKIGQEAGEWTASNLHPYLPPETYLTCRFFSARKHGLVDAIVRSSSSNRTAVVALPGGIGTLDEVFEILALIQLERIGSKLPVPFPLMNYDSFYSKLLDFLDDCEGWGTVSKGEVASLWTVCDNNLEALTYLAEFYNLPLSDKDKHGTELQSIRGTISAGRKKDKFENLPTLFSSEVLSDTKDSASTTNSHDKNVNLSISIFPYLRTYSFKMHLFSILRSITYPPSTKQERMNNTKERTKEFRLT
ncbi:hypothetical protein CFP56_013391 [Quercus suber]|uniref:Cytokinin riboside 5'-monophosphate phosphoribohydrolase n=1 Tax=Quercus suber TaxID=58331 RepID=A0AAW0KVM6_QUESU